VQPLENLDADLERRGVELWVARANEPLRKLLQVTGLTQRLGKDNVYPSVRAAVIEYRARFAPSSM
jgi:sulfate permease, SulP family